MNRRKAIKILLHSPYYWKIWTSPDGNDHIRIPKSGKHWYLFLKACDKLGSIGKTFRAHVLSEFQIFMWDYYEPKQ